MKAIDPHGPRDVLDLLLTPVLEGVRELVPDLLIDLPRDRDPPGLRQLLQPGRDIHAIPVHIAILLDHDVTEVDADAELEGLGGLLSGL